MSARHIQPARVVLLHSSGSSARQWRAAVTALHAAGVHDVHAVEVHGHGAQPAWRGERPLALDDELALLAPLVQRIGGAHVVGHSYGGAVALAAALRWPQHVRSVVAYEPVLFSLLREDPAGSAPELQAVLAAVAAMHDELAAGRPLRAAQRFVEIWSGRVSWQRLDAERREGVAVRMPAVMGQFGALFDAPFGRAELARLRMPLRVLHGGATVPVARRIVGLLREALPRAHHEALDGLGHMGPVTHAEAFNRRLLELLAPVLHEHAPPPALPFTLQGEPA